MSPMSRFFSEKYKNLTAYTPGEQPRDRRYIKLNTNESPYPPSAPVMEAVAAECGRLELYSDPACTELVKTASSYFDVPQDCLIMTNGSDEVLNFAFMAFSDADHPIVFPDVTYGFYPVFAALSGIPYEEIPLAEDFSVRVSDYVGIGKNIVLANPNAPTGLALPLSAIEEIVASNLRHVVIIDEAYVDFGAESAVPLVKKYDNLLVTGTFSKSRSMAGARLGFGIGNPALIRDLKTIQYSTNPYNVNRMTAAAGRAALLDDGYYKENCRKIARTRETTRQALLALGFEVTDSKANFLFARSEKIEGEALALALRRRGILVRHFAVPRIRAYNRITVGTPEQMETLLSAIKEILEEGPDGTGKEAKRETK